MSLPIPFRIVTRLLAALTLFGALRKSCAGSLASLTGGVDALCPCADELEGAGAMLIVICSEEGYPNMPTELRGGLVDAR